MHSLLSPTFEVLFSQSYSHQSRYCIKISCKSIEYVSSSQQWRMSQDLVCNSIVCCCDVVWLLMYRMGSHALECSCFTHRYTLWACSHKQTCVYRLFSSSRLWRVGNEEQNVNNIYHGKYVFVHAITPAGCYIRTDPARACASSSIPTIRYTSLKQPSLLCQFWHHRHQRQHRRQHCYCVRRRLVHVLGMHPCLCRSRPWPTFVTLYVSMCLAIASHGLADQAYLGRLYTRCIGARHLSGSTRRCRMHWVWMLFILMVFVHYVLTAATTSTRFSFRGHFIYEL